MGPGGYLRRIGKFFLGGGGKYFFSGPKSPPSISVLAIWAVVADSSQLPGLNRGKLEGIQLVLRLTRVRESVSPTKLQPQFVSQCQGRVSAAGILHLVNPNFGSNSGMRIFEPRIWGPNCGVEFFGPMFSNKKSPLKNSPSRNSPPKIHIKNKLGR